MKRSTPDWKARRGVAGAAADDVDTDTVARMEQHDIALRMEIIQRAYVQGLLARARQEIQRLRKARQSAPRYEAVCLTVEIRNLEAMLSPDLRVTNGGGS